MRDFLREWMNRARAFFRKAPLDEDLDAEMASHLEWKRICGAGWI
jgi:hypothetical protein